MQHVQNTLDFGTIRRVESVWFFVFFLFFLMYASCLSFSDFVRSRSRCLCRLSYPLVVLEYFVIRLILFDIVFSALFLTVENRWSI